MTVTGYLKIVLKIWYTYLAPPMEELIRFPDDISLVFRCVYVYGQII